MKPRYVFIVGLPRTGTKLIRNIIRNAPDTPCTISPETGFVGHFLSPGIRHKIKKFGDLSDEANVRKLVDHMYAGDFRETYWRRLKKGTLAVDKETFYQEILNSDRSDKSIYEIILRIHTDLSDGMILGDKAPGNIYHVPTLLEWFPEAKVVHTFRDPRAILASELRKRTINDPSAFHFIKPTNPFYSFSIVLHVTITWLYAVRLHQKYKKHYPQNYYLSRFEDIVSEPEYYIRQLCKFLDVEFDSRMLSPRQAGSSYERQDTAGIDKQTLTRWHDHLKPWMKIWFSFWGGKHLKEFDYSR